MTDYERWESHVEPEPMSGCWLWTGWTSGEPRYPLFYAHRRKIFAHRWILQHLGRLPAGLIVDHLCRVPMCVNPQHLEAVDFRTNIIRGIGPTAVNARKTRCIRGHLFSPRWNRRNGPNSITRYCVQCNTRKRKETTG